MVNLKNFLELECIIFKTKTTKTDLQFNLITGSKKYSAFTHVT